MRSVVVFLACLLATAVLPDARNIAHADGPLPYAPMMRPFGARPFGPRPFGPRPFAPRLYGLPMRPMPVRPIPVGPNGRGVAVIPGPLGPGRPGFPGRVCFNPAETRDKIIAHGLAEPFRAFRPGRFQGQPLRARLCRWNPGEFVYDIAVLQNDGRIVHFYVNATNGQPLRAFGGPDRP